MTTDAARHNDHQRAYFTGRRLPRMDPRERSSTPYTQRHVAAMIDALALQPGDDVLDAGSGPGKYTIALARKGVRVQAMDLTPALVEELQRVQPDMPAHVGDIASPPEDLHHQFDAVTGFFMLHHLLELTAAFQGVRSLLRPGGRAGFLEPNPLFPGYYAQITLTPGMSWRGERGIFAMREHVIRDHAHRAGFDRVHVTRFGAFPPVLANRAAGQKVERALESIPGWQKARAFQLFVLS